MDMFYASKKYDLIVPVGAWCIATHALRKNMLQEESLPFDWLAGVSFRKAIGFMKTGFEGFLALDNLKSTGEIHHETVCVHHKDGFLFVHDFPKDDTIENSLASVTEKYDRRIKRLYNRIERAERILFFHLNLQHATAAELMEMHEDLVAAYPGKIINILYLYMAKGQPYSDEQINENIRYVCLNSTLPATIKKGDEWQGNRKMLKKALKSYRVPGIRLNDLKRRIKKFPRKIARVFRLN